jgi:hypothetical protein
VSAVPDPIAPPSVEAPDRDFAAAREHALQVVAGSAEATWTDHNAPDPGITMLEAIAWGVADLHYRTARRDLGAWPLEVAVDALPAEPHWSGVPLAADPTALLELAAALADPAPDGRTVAANLADGLERAGSSHAAATAIVGNSFAAGSGPVVFTWEQATAAVRLLRGPVVLRGALDGSALVTAALDEAEDDDARAVAILRTEPLFEGIWEEELHALLRRERRRRDVALVQALAGTIATTSDPLAMVAELNASPNDLAADDAEVALALHPCPDGALPEQWEDADGATRVWPPHPIQARTCEPITAEDYARRARGAPDVLRAWAVPGVVLPGVGWDGRVVAATETRAGAITLLVEPAIEITNLNRTTYLKNVLRAALGAPPAAEVDDPFQLWRDELDSAPPRRTICDEVGAAVLGRCEITLKGILHAPAGSDRVAVIERALERVAAFFAEGRAETRPEADGPLECPGGIEGAWPQIPQPSGGWTPGDPIRLSELVQRLADDPLVIGMEGLQVAIGGGDWLPDPGITGAVPLPPDCVPELAERQCVRVTLALATECGGG